MQARIDLLSKVTGKNVSRETIDVLDEFAALLFKWNQKINLVSKKVNPEELWQRHIVDSAQIVKFIPEDKDKIIDFGSGAGFPGLILSVLGDYHVTLIESDLRKCAFMQEASARFGLRVNILSSRIESVAPINCDVITSRALAPLSMLLEYAYPFLKKNNFMLLLKGQNVVEEIKEASIYWDFEHDFNRGAFEGGVLKIFNVTRRRDEMHSK